MNLFSAPDGTMYVVDMYRGVVQAGGIWIEYLTGYIKKNEMLMPVGYGRIWRVVYGTGRDARGPKPALSKATPQAARGDAVASERLVARHGAAAARRAPRQSVSAGARSARGVGAGLADETPRAVDAGRNRMR